MLEISKAVDQITRAAPGGAGSLWVLPLHGGLTAAEQAQVFQRAPAGKRKVSLATNNTAYSSHH